MIRLVFVYFSAILWAVNAQVLFGIDNNFALLFIGFIYGAFVADKIMDMLGFPK